MSIMVKHKMFKTGYCNYVLTYAWYRSIDILNSVDFNEHVEMCKTELKGRYQHLDFITTDYGSDVDPQWPFSLYKGRMV